MPKHSIIISSYNRPIYIAQAISSVLSQTKDDWEALIADDGSTSETISAIKKASAGDPRVRLLECRTPYVGENRGAVPERYAERINDALAISSGEILHYLADDDWFDPGRLATFENLFANPGIMVGYGRLVYVDREGRPYGEERFPPGPTRDVRWKMDHNQFAHRRSIFEKVPRWPIRAGEFELDALFFAALAEHWDFYPVDRIVAYKRMHSFNVTNTRQFTTTKRE